jgi:hypothetical protein
MTMISDLEALRSLFARNSPEAPGRKLPAPPISTTSTSLPRQRKFGESPRGYADASSRRQDILSDVVISDNKRICSGKD